MKTLHWTKKLKQRGAMLTAAALIFSVAAAPVYAAEQSVPKDEIVYVNMDASGAVEEIYVVNSFSLSAPATITDYGSYTALTELTADAPVTQEGETITLQAPKGKVNYEGKLGASVTPWDIAVRYYLNGKAIAPQEVAGKSGALQIVLEIRQNKSVDEAFFAHYALQIAVTLDGENCKNIVAKDATIANAGAQKQLAFIVMPGTESTLELSADVADFAMPGISVNGVVMNLSVDVNSLLEKNETFANIGDLGEKFTELTDGTKSLVDGMGALSDGARTLHDGAAGLQGGAQQLADGASALQGGVDGLQGGAQQLADGLGTVSANGAPLVAGARQMADGLLAQVTQQLNAQLTAQGMPAVPALTLENYREILGGLAGVTDAMRANAKAGVLAALPEGTPDPFPIAAILANGQLATGAAATPQDAAQQALQMLGAAQTVQAAAEALAAAGGVPLQIPAVAGVLGGMAQGMQLPGAPEVYAALTAGLQQAQPAPDEASCALMITLACLTASSGGAFDLAGVGQIMQTAAPVQAAAALPADQAAAEEAKFLTALVMADPQFAALGAALAPLNAQLDGVAAFYSGVVQYTDGVTKLSEGAGALASGTAALQGGAGELAGGAHTLSSGLADYQAGAAQYQQGVTSVYGGVKQLHDGTSAFEDISSFTDPANTENLFNDLMGGDFTPVSFTSPKNTAVHSVQFVMKTAAITVPETEATVEPEAEKSTFLQRVRNLFVK